MTQTQKKHLESARCRLHAAQILLELMGEWEVFDNHAIAARIDEITAAVSNADDLIAEALK